MGKMTMMVAFSSLSVAFVPNMYGVLSVGLL